MLQKTHVETLQKALNLLREAEKKITDVHAFHTGKTELRAAQDCISEVICEDMADEYLDAEAREATFARLFEAKRLIEKGVEIMTPEQVGQWDGVREWQETV